MPNRILKESICTSDSIDALSWFEETVFYRLMVNCDDYGRFDGRSAIVKNRLFPLKGSVTTKSIDCAINKLVLVGLVCRYIVNGKPFLFLPTWSAHQITRAVASKYPDPREADEMHVGQDVYEQMIADENICKQMKSNEIICKQPNANVSVFVFEFDIRNRYTREGAGAHAHTHVRGDETAEEPKTKREAERAHGEYGNVMLTDREYDKLKDAYPMDYQQRIDRLDEYMEQSGKKYSSHYATIKAWAKRDETKGAPRAGGGSFDTDDFYEAAVRRSLGDEASSF